MRRPSTFLQRSADTDIQMTSMIDVVFQLMIFFIWTSGVHLTEYMLPSRVSDSSTSATGVTPHPSAETDFHELVIRILWQDSRPQWQINQRNLASLAAVRQEAREIFAVAPQAPLIIHPDPETPLEYVIQIYDLTRLIGFQKVHLAVSTHD